MVSRPIVALLVTAFASDAIAHDFWIEPKAYRTNPSLPIDFSLKVGFADEVDELPWRDHHCERCVLVLGDEEFTVLGAPESLPALTLDFAKNGTWTLGYRSFDRFLELEADKFEAYLREEGLERIVEERAARGESRKSAKESYSRCAKTLIRIGPFEGVDRPGPKPIGQPLELIAELDPYSLGTDTELPVRLLLRGEPLAGALVEATRGDDHRRTIAARSDADGRVEFTLEPGPWRVAAVHMERAPKGPTSDWRSLWATLTFERVAVLAETRTAITEPVAESTAGSSKVVGDDG